MITILKFVGLKCRFKQIKYFNDKSLDVKINMTKF